MIRLRAVWKVHAGVILDEPMPEYSKMFQLTSEDPDGQEAFDAKRDEAYAYAKELTNPRMLNWVRVDWIWV